MASTQQPPPLDQPVTDAGTKDPGRPPTVRDFMRQEVVGLRARDSLAHALELMRAAEVEQLVVFDPTQLVGVLSLADAERFLSSAQEPFSSQENRWFGTTRVARTIPLDQVVVPLQLVRADTPACQAAQLLRDSGAPCLLVLEEHTISGVVTAADLPSLPEQPCSDQPGEPHCTCS